MFLTIVILFLLLLILLFFDRRNRYSLFLSTMTLGIMLAFAVLTYLISHFSEYYAISSTNPFASLDAKIYIFIIRHFHVPHHYALRIMNAGHFLFQISAVLICREVCACCTFQRPSPKPLRIILRLLFVTPFLFVLFSDPLTSLYFYVRRHQPRRFLTLLNALFQMERLLLIGTVSSPVIAFFCYMRQIRPSRFKRQTLLLGIGMSLLMTGYIYVFMFSAFSMSVDTLWLTGYWVFSVTLPSNQISYLLPVLTILLMGLCVVLQLLFRIDATAVFAMERTIRENLKLMNNALEDTLHSYKNTLFAMKLQMRKVTLHANEEAKPEAEKMSRLVDDVLNDTTRMLDHLSTPHYQFHQTALSDLVREAVREISVPEGVTVDLDESVNVRLMGYYDRYHVKKAIVNILSNAVQAIEKAGKPQGTIHVEMAFFFNWSVLVITDNGIGMNKTVRKKIFLPHYSNHASKLNFGLGMSYVYRVVNAHLGRIRIYSKPMQYTSVVLFFPMKNRRSGND